MVWTKWIVILLVAPNAGYMTFDGARALIVGDYITSGSGEYAGQLGPWAKIVEAASIDPRSTGMKWVFVGYGALALLACLAFALGLPGSWWGMLIMAALGLWYLPFGAMTGIIAILLLLLLPQLRMMA